METGGLRKRKLGHISYFIERAYGALCKCGPQPGSLGPYPLYIFQKKNSRSRHLYFKIKSQYGFFGESYGRSDDHGLQFCPKFLPKLKPCLHPLSDKSLASSHQPAATVCGQLPATHTRGG